MSVAYQYRFCLGRILNLQIETPIAPIVHPKMDSGKESVANAEFGMRIFQNETPHVVSYGKNGA